MAYMTQITDNAIDKLKINIYLNNEVKNGIYIMPEM